MASKDLHDEPFSASTLTKLRIFGSYAEAWIPTFVMQGEPRIAIIDLFAGTGYDKEGVAGSPIILLRALHKFTQHIFKNGVKVELYYNEYKKKKFRVLQEACREFIEEHEHLRRCVTIHYFNEDFEVAFNEVYPVIQSIPSLVFLDQNGMKFLNLKYLTALEKTQKTDFLYFLSSSHVGRFGDTEEFKRHLDIDIERLRNEPYRYIHSNLIGELRALLPTDSKLQLYPFSLKKGPNIYGLIFGAKSHIAVDKFLRVVWTENPVNGTANYDIDDEASIPAQLNFFEERRKTKLEAFEEDFEQIVLNLCPTTNKILYLRCLEMGHPPPHAYKVLKKMKKLEQIHYEGRSPKISNALKKSTDLVKITRLR